MKAAGVRAGHEEFRKVMAKFGAKKMPEKTGSGYGAGRGR
jgi:hypothetical protein